MYGFLQPVHIKCYTADGESSIGSKMFGVNKWDFKMMEVLLAKFNDDVNM